MLVFLLWKCIVFSIRLIFFLFLSLSFLHSIPHIFRFKFFSKRQPQVGCGQLTHLTSHGGLVFPISHCKQFILVQIHPWASFPYTSCSIYFSLGIEKTTLEKAMVITQRYDLIGKAVKQYCRMINRLVIFFICKPKHTAVKESIEDF